MNAEFEVLKGKILTEIEVSVDEIIFTVKGGDRYKLYHRQDCGESVYVEDVVGDIADLLGSEILVAEEVSSDPLNRPEKTENNYAEESETWTYYKLDTIKGGVTIRWYSTSNGCYSEYVDFTKLG